MFSTVTAQASASFQGLTGLAEMRSPETLGGWRSEVYLGGRIAALTEDQGAQGYIALGLTQGLGESLEAGFQIPLLVSSAGTSLSMPVLAKWRLIETQKFEAALTGFAVFPLHAGDTGSGDIGGGGELNLLLAVGKADFLLNGSYELNDYGPGALYPGMQIPSPRRTPILRLQGGIRYRTGLTTVFTEGHALNAFNGDKGGLVPGDPDMRFVIGVRTRFLEQWAVTYHAGIGLPDWSRANQAFSFGMRLHHTFDMTGGAP